MFAANYSPNYSESSHPHRKRKKSKKIKSVRDGMDGTERKIGHRTVELRRSQVAVGWALMRQFKCIAQGRVATRSQPNIPSRLYDFPSSFVSYLAYGNAYDEVVFRS